MFKFSNRSFDKLLTCHPNLIALMEEAIKSSPIDFSIICGHRNEKAQNEAFIKGYSKASYPYSKHNTNPSVAVDIQPYPYTEADKIDPEHIKFRVLNEHIKKIAHDLDIVIINGGLDWGWDWFHWELVF